MGSAMDKLVGSLPALGVLRSASSQGESPGHAGRVVPAREKRQTCPDPAAPAQPHWEEVAGAFVPGSSQHLGQHLLTRCAPRGGGSGRRWRCMGSIRAGQLPARTEEKVL